ncbi:mannose-1-phosphate guanylyltransferase [Cohnella terricola]|uniref:mannose-1-phosphate guanylyltransferase n=1 Tax=Cohnella terricola TaxID=1289167 RepID=A0A559JB48_9BACL|nr:mannose-1-phosphate guanylyltransferase [Cohnella terricola]TVX97081.1 mannose-1-phosphate guanylyltransferase [Cohnella terricola]
MITSLIMAGGKGERFWPKSRTNLPKQFLNISGNKSMIQQAVARLERLMQIEQIFIVTNELYAELISAQIPHLPIENLIIEPSGRNTAPSIALSSLYIEERYPDSTIIVLPSDHIIKNEGEFVDILKTASEVAESGENIVTLGITPTYPETGYGYIESANEISTLNNLEVHRVRRFVEKPDSITAESYVTSGNYYWNSGMFIWKSSTILECFKKFMPAIYEIMMEIQHKIKAGAAQEAIHLDFAKMPEESIDYGIMEKADNIFVIPCKFGWDDVGSWTALDRINERDDFGNVIKGNILNIDTKRCIIESNNGKLVATLGIEDLIVVDTDDVTLICSKEKAQEMKLLLKELRVQKMEQYL